MIYDIVGIGFGPANIALAIRMEESCYDGNVIFVERNATSSWHEGMLLKGSDVQNNLLRDLVTPINPSSKYTFVNYLHKSGRFFHYLNLGRNYPLRKDFFNYVRWAAEHFDNVRYGSAVEKLDTVAGDCRRRLWSVRTSSGKEYLARRIVLGTGRNLNVPQGIRLSNRIVHLSQYLEASEGLPKNSRIAVLGASQSAVEILLDLMDKGYERISSIHRSFSFRLKDTSPFSDEVYFPEFVDYYHALRCDKRALLDAQVRQTNYSTADRDIVDRLYVQIYEEALDRKERVRILRNHEITGVQESSEAVHVDVREVYTGRHQQLDLDLLILATGFLDVGRNGRAGLPGLLQPHSGTFKWLGDYLEVERAYRVSYVDEAAGLPDIYLNGLCESSHGLGDAGSFSLVSLRARDILNSIREREAA